MALTVLDARTGKPAPLALGAALASGPGPREKASAAALARAAEYVGTKLSPAGSGKPAVFVGEKDPGEGVVWMKVAPETGAGEERALAFLRLKTRYSVPLRADAPALAAAAAERERLLGALAALSGAPDAVSPRAVAGYLHRFRDALSRDLDMPEAVACVWDALRPGALSPGSRAALLREAFPVLDLP